MLSRAAAAAAAAANRCTDLVVMAGPLRKEGGGTSVFGRKTWKARFFELRATSSDSGCSFVLSYYKDLGSETKTKARGGGNVILLTEPARTDIELDGICARLTAAVELSDSQDEGGTGSSRQARKLSLKATPRKGSAGSLQRTMSTDGVGGAG